MKASGQKWSSKCRSTNGELRMKTRPRLRASGGQAPKQSVGGMKNLDIAGQRITHQDDSKIKTTFSY